MDLKPAVVIDAGSGVFKVGIAGEEEPEAMFASLIAKSRSDILFAEEAQEKKGGLFSLAYVQPVKKGLITHNEDFERILEYSLKTRLKDKVLRIEDRPILITESPLAPKENKELLAHLLFETFHVPAMFVCNSATLALYSVGKTTGVAVESGAGVTHVAPVKDGHCITAAVMELELAGHHLSNYLLQLLQNKGYTLGTNPFHASEQARLIKEKFAYFAENFQEEEETQRNNDADLIKEYTLPDGKSVSITKERYQCTEPLFNPQLLHIEGLGIPDMIVTSINACEASLRQSLYSGIALSGGSTMFPGIVDRLYKELRARAPSMTKLDITADSERKWGAWYGGAVLASLPSFEDMWVTAEEYDEFGPTIVHKKCVA